MRTRPTSGSNTDPVVRWLRFSIWALASSISLWVLVGSATHYWAVAVGAAFIPALLVAAAAMHPHRFRLDSKLRTVDPNRVQLMGPMFVVALALALRAFVLYDVVFGPNFFYCSTLSGLCVGLLIWAAIKRASLWVSFGLAMLFCSALVVHINGLSLSEAHVLDRGTITQKYISKRGAAKVLVIKSDRRETYLHVNEATYQTYAPGAQACVFARSGSLGVQFRYFGACQDGA